MKFMKCPHCMNTMRGLSFNDDFYCQQCKILSRTTKNNRQRTEDLLARHKQKTKTKLTTDTDPTSPNYGLRTKVKTGGLSVIPNAVLNGFTGNSLPKPRPIKPNSNPTFKNPASSPFNNNNPFLVGMGKKKKTKTKVIPKISSDEELKNILNDKDFVKELEKSGIDNEALNIIRERLRKKLNGELEKEQNKIPRYSEIED